MKYVACLGLLASVGWWSAGCAVFGENRAAGGYGALAYAADTQDWRLRWGVNDPQRARQRALKDCGATVCRIVLEFGPRQCGTLALSDTGKSMGVGVGDTAAAAETVALEECRRAGESCRVAPAECNTQN